MTNSKHIWQVQVARLVAKRMSLRRFLAFCVVSIAAAIFLQEIEHWRNSVNPNASGFEYAFRLCVTWTVLALVAIGGYTYIARPAIRAVFEDLARSQSGAPGSGRGSRDTVPSPSNEDTSQGS